MTLDSKLHTIAITYGRESQLRKAIEESGEFLAEAGRYLNGENNDEALISEIADVLNVFTQLKDLIGGGYVQAAQESKADRQILRIKQMS